MLVSALNERLDRMDVGHARKVFVDGFLSTRTGFQMELPLVPLGELYGGRLENWLRKSGVDVQLTSGIRMVDLDDDASMRGVVLRTGQRIVADFVILAVSFDRAPSLLPEAARSRLPALEAASARSSRLRSPEFISGLTARSARWTTWRRPVGSSSGCSITRPSRDDRQQAPCHRRAP